MSKRILLMNIIEYNVYDIFLITRNIQRWHLETIEDHQIVIRD